VLVPAQAQEPVLVPAQAQALVLVPAQAQAQVQVQVQVQVRASTLVSCALEPRPSRLPFPLPIRRSLRMRQSSMSRRM
jgi:hypothetical protein